MDFVIIWVDGNDPEWQKEYFKYSNNDTGGDKREIRFREWDNLKYWFRGIEKFAPWVDKVFLVTCGHYPSWLNLKAPKLRFIRHSDYIPHEYLPTFNANTIELNLHRIPELSENFVFFNDDFFLINSVKENRFFHNGLPCDMAILNALSGGGISSMELNALGILNNYFVKKEVINANLKQWYNLKYGTSLLRTLCLMPWPRFTGFLNPHLPQAFTKKTFEELWNKEYKILNDTCLCKFRTSDNVNQYLMRFWQFAKGEFYPLNVQKKTAYYLLSSSNIHSVAETISKQTADIIILNDSEQLNFEYSKEIINSSFEKILSDKSTFEI